MASRTVTQRTAATRARLLGLAIPILLMIGALGCANKAVETTVLRSLPAAVIGADEADIAPVTLDINAPLEAVWDQAHRSAAPGYWILAADRANGVMILVEFASLQDGTIAEFPLRAVLVAEREGWTKVTVRAIATDDLGLKEKQLADYRVVHESQAREFVRRLQAEIEPEQRWPWLRQDQ